VGAQAGRFEQGGAHLVQRQSGLHMRQGQRAVPPGEAQHRLAAHHQIAVGRAAQQGGAQVGPIGGRLGQQKHRPIPVGHIGIIKISRQFGNQRGSGRGIGRPIGGGKLLQAGGSGGVDTGHKQQYGQL
jgi:hypothetical protein